MTKATLREAMITEFRSVTEAGRTYQSPTAWDTPAGSTYHDTKAFAECLANAIVDNVSVDITFLSNVINFFDPSSALPADPVSGDRYIASATGNGWTLNYIYEYNGATWDETIPAQNECVWVTALGDFYTYNGTIWTAWGMAIDHGALTGLADDDHTQYYNQTRGDARYEKLLGNPSTDGYILSSTAAGVRSWIAPVTGGVPTTRQIIAGIGLTGGGDLTADRTLAVTGILATFYGLSNAAGWLHNNGAGVLAYTTPSKSDVGLGNVENTALSTWSGSTSITTLGTITTGVWNGAVIGAAYIADLSAIYQPLKAILTSIGNLSSSTTGLIKLTNGTASLDSSAYLTANQTITLSGAVTGSGTTAITTAFQVSTAGGFLGHSGTTSSVLAMITSSTQYHVPIIGASSALAFGYLTSGSFGSNILAVANGGTGLASWTQYGLVYASGTTTLASLGTGTSGYALISGGSAAPSWSNLALIYQPLSSILTSVAALSGSSTGLIKLTNGTASLDASTYLTTAVMDGYLPLTAGSGKALTGNLYGIGAILSGTADNAVQINNAIATTYSHAVLSLNSLCATSGYRNLYEIGYTSSSANTANFGFCFQSSGSTTNFLTMGLYGYNDLLKITAAGVATFSGSVVTPALTVSGLTAGFVKSSASGVFSVDNTAYGTGSVTSVAMTVPTGLTISGSPITTSGTLGLSLTSGYSIPTTANQTNWSSAYTFTNGFTTNYPDLVAIEALSGTAGFLKKTAANTWALDNSTYLSTAVTSLSATTPIVASASTGAVTLTHATSGATAGTYKSVTVNTYGHVTAGTNPTTLAGYGIIDAAPLTHGCSSGYIPYATSTTAWGTSPMQTNGAQIGLGGAAISGSCINIVSTTGKSMQRIQVGTAGVWEIGPNSGANTTDETFSVYSGTYGTAHSYAPIMTLTTTGNVGIGTTIPTNKLSVVGASSSTAYSIGYFENSLTNGTALYGGASSSSGDTAVGVAGYAPGGAGGYFYGGLYGAKCYTYASNGVGLICGNENYGIGFKIFSGTFNFGDYQSVTLSSASNTITRTDAVRFAVLYNNYSSGIPTVYFSGYNKGDILIVKNNGTAYCSYTQMNIYPNGTNALALSSGNTVVLYCYDNSSHFIPIAEPTTYGKIIS
jgi:hypothetical protein